MKKEKQPGSAAPIVITFVLLALFVGAGVVLSRYVKLPDGFLSTFRTSPWEEMHGRYHNLSSRGKQEEAVQVIRQALVYARENYGDWSRQTCVSLMDLTEGLMELGRYEEAVDTGTKALERARVVYKESRHQIVRCQKNLGIQHFHMKDYETSEKWFARARETQNTIDDDIWHRAEVLDWIARVQVVQDRWDESIPIYEEMLEAYDDTVSFAGEIIDVRGNLAWARAKTGDLEASDEIFAVALTAAEKYFGKESAQYAELLLDMADLNAEMERYKSAEDMYRTGIDLLKGLPDTVSPAADDGLDRLANYYTERAMPEQAIRTYREMLSWLEERHGEMDLEAVYPHQMLGLALEEAGRLTEALTHYRKVVQITETAPEAMDEDRRDAYITLAEALERVPDKPQAAVYREKAEALEE